MLPIYLLVLLGFGVAYGIYEALDDDDENLDQTITGTEGDDSLTGGPGDDDMFGLGGNDTMDGLSANDALVAGEGNDLMQGGEGNDRLVGGAGFDIGLGGPGEDTLRGNEDTDILIGGDGDDTLLGNRGDDWLDGQDGDDIVNGGSQSDNLIGGGGADTLTGEGGDDLLVGGDLLTRALSVAELAALRDATLSGEGANLPPGVDYRAGDDGDADVLDAGPGDDMLMFGRGDMATGGPGDDLFYLLGGIAADPAQVMDFDGAEDRLIYVHDEGTPEPALSLTDNGDSTQTLVADGETVAVLAATGLTAEDILFYERGSEPGFVV